MGSEPLDIKTLPYLTIENTIFFLPTILFALIKSLSEHNLVAPYKFIGAAALSVESAITFLTLVCIQASIIFCAPSIFVLMNSKGFYSAVGTCFNAAA